MFKENKYTKWYFDIIKNRQLNPITDDTYTEKHHIIPKSMGGTEGTNLVALTGREHYICHALLVRMTEGKFRESMVVAFNYMHVSSREHNGNRYINSKLYEVNRTEFAKVQSIRQSGKNNSNYGKRWITDIENMTVRKVSSDHINGKFELNGGYKKFIDNGWTKSRFSELYIHFMNTHETIQMLCIRLYDYKFAGNDKVKIFNVWKVLYGTERISIDTSNKPKLSFSNRKYNTIIPLSENKHVIKSEICRSEAVELFELFKEGDYTSVRSFHKHIYDIGRYGYTVESLLYKFNKYIPEYKEKSSERFKVSSSTFK
jgi:hypothetical protein